MRQFIELSFVWKDKRRKNSIQRLEMKECRLISQIFDEQEMECVEVRVKEIDIDDRDEFLNWLIS